LLLVFWERKVHKKCSPKINPNSHRPSDHSKLNENQCQKLSNNVDTLRTIISRCSAQMENKFELCKMLSWVFSLVFFAWLWICAKSGQRI
jgi:hypothetical protein